MGMKQQTNKQKDNQTYLTTLLSMSTDMTGMPHTICSSWWYVRRERSGMDTLQQYPQHKHKQTDNPTNQRTWQLSWVYPPRWRACHTPSALAGDMSGGRGVGWGWSKTCLPSLLPPASRKHCITMILSIDANCCLHFHIVITFDIEKNYFWYTPVQKSANCEKNCPFIIWRVSSQNGLYPFCSIWDIWDLSCWSIKKIIRNFVILLSITSKIFLYIYWERYH